MTNALGIAMNGLEDSICKIAREIGLRFDEVTYVEIGIGEGMTLSGIARELRMVNKRWRAIGVELPNGYSFNQQQTMEICLMRGLPLTFENPKTIVHPKWERVTVYFKDSQSFLTEYWNEPIHLALVDGCHGKPCVMADFLAIESCMEPGGVVMFHDFTEDQIGNIQPHCATGIDVRGACRELGLTKENRRAGWQWTDTLVADRMQGGWDMGVFTKTSLRDA
jgi:hypothetical protein